jgi:hypothetical protein
MAPAHNGGEGIVVGNPDGTAGDASGPAMSFSM